MGGRGSSMRSSSGYASINDDIADERDAAQRYWNAAMSVGR